jgi:hypothetical protein
MDMLVRINVGRGLGDEPAEGVELPVHFTGHGCRVLKGNDLVQRSPGAVPVNPFAQVEVEADREARMDLAIAGCLCGGRPAYHEAGAGDNAALVRRDYAAVHARALAEIVRIDYQASARLHQSESQIDQELGEHALGVKVFLSNLQGRPDMQIVVGIDLLEGGHGLVQRVEGKQPAAGR